MPMAEDVRRFVLTSIPSVPFLEALLLLRETAPASWEPFGLARRLYVDEASALRLLQSLQESGMAARDAQGQFSYQPSTPELADLVTRVSESYAGDLVGITTLIHSRLEKRALQFADAFRLKKDR